LAKAETFVGIGYENPTLHIGVPASSDHHRIASLQAFTVQASRVIRVGQNEKMVCAEASTPALLLRQGFFFAEYLHLNGGRKTMTSFKMVGRQLRDHTE